MFFVFFFARFIFGDHEQFQQRQRRRRSAANGRHKSAASSDSFFLCVSFMQPLRETQHRRRRDFLLNQISCGLLKSNGKHMAEGAAVAGQQGAGVFKPAADRSVFIWEVLFISCSWFWGKAKEPPPTPSVRPSVRLLPSTHFPVFFCVAQTRQLCVAVCEALRLISELFKHHNPRLRTIPHSPSRDSEPLRGRRRGRVSPSGTCESVKNTTHQVVSTFGRHKADAWQERHNFGFKQISRSDDRKTLTPSRS